MSFLRARQRIITALSPHPGNRTHLIPTRFFPPAGTVSVSATAKTTSISVTFSGDVQGLSIAGYTITVNAVGATVLTVVPGISADIIDVTFSPAGIATQNVILTYDGTGILSESPDPPPGNVPLAPKIPSFVESALIV